MFSSVADILSNENICVFPHENWGNDPIIHEALDTFPAINL